MNTPSAAVEQEPELPPEEQARRDAAEIFAKHGPAIAKILSDLASRRPLNAVAEYGEPVAWLWRPADGGPCEPSRGIWTDHKGAGTIDPLYSAATVSALVAERDEARARADACQLQAQIWKGEAMAQKSSLLEAYQIVTGATGEPGDWNGAVPIRDAVAALKARNAELVEENAELRDLLGKFAPPYADWMDEWADDQESSLYRRGSTFGDLRRARAALQSQEPRNG